MKCELKCIIKRPKSDMSACHSTHFSNDVLRPQYLKVRNKEATFGSIMCYLLSVSLSCLI